MGGMEGSLGGGGGSHGQPGSTPTPGIRALPPSKAQGLRTGKAGVGPHTEKPLGVLALGIREKAGEEKMMCMFRGLINNTKLLMAVNVCVSHAQLK